MSADVNLATRVAASLRADARWKWWEIALLAALAASWWAPDAHVALLNQIAITALFAVSLDLVLGYAGVVSLGHAAFFGLGAYGAALLGMHVFPDPLLGLAAATAMAALLGLATSFLVLRGTDLTRLMVTIGVCSVLYELANRFAGLTGGADGLQVGTVAPLLGRFEFDFVGRTGYAYTLVVLFASLLLSRRLVQSDYGMSLQALRDNALRASSIGLSVNARIVAVYTVAAAMAGAAGALQAQTTAFASLDVLAFHTSADLMLMVVIGGAGYLYGGIFGAIAFKGLHHLFSTWTPQYWTFWLGLFLVVLMLVGRDRLVRPWTWFRRGRA
ncbi:branched-chain amino acid ABC transporter permease [Pseudorhodoferax sp. LjRoot39]|uniref:branched-chain amino acid ABC transporter permease n=1 Tax=Pseudorhodoferax sp. LjRoot39 TaxID=3342328 RepID=UPI003ECDF005